MKQIGIDILEAVGHVTDEYEDLNKFVPKRCFNKIEAINKELQELKNMTGDEYPELLDTSAGYESFTKIIGPVKIEDGCVVYTEKDDDYWRSNREPTTERERIIDFDEDEQTYYFRDYEWKDVIRYFTNGIRKAKKYFLEYNPEWDEDEEKRDKFLGDM